MITSGRDTFKVECTYEKLKSVVLANQLRPNEHLQINNLADRLKVSVTPLREALIRLTGEGLIESHPHRGFFAKVLSISEFHDLSQFAYLLLESSLQCGIHRFGSEWLADIREAEGTACNRRGAQAAAHTVEQLYEK